MSTLTNTLDSTHLGHFLLTTLSLPTLATITTAATLLLPTLTIGFLTVAIYRIYLHPLSSYPGPILAKLTPLYSTYHAYLGDRHLLLHRLHAEYGTIVRWAPNAVSINDSTALKEIYGHGPSSRLVRKSDFYKAFPAVKGVHNTHNAIDTKVHARKRRVLAQAFSEAALRGLEGLVLGTVQTFFEEVERKMSVADAGGVEEGVLTGSAGERGLDMGEMFSWLTFDVMGELCFGKAFGMLRDRSQRFVTGLIEKAAHMHYIVRTKTPQAIILLPWLTLRLVRELPPPQNPRSRENPLPQHRPG